MSRLISTLSDWVQTLYFKILSAYYARVMFKEGMTEEADRRLQICNLCPYNTDNRSKKTIREMFWIWANRMFNKLFGIKVSTESVCSVCGCGTIFLAQGESADGCKKNKW